jgi:hypothetical protein
VAARAWPEVWRGVSHEGREEPLVLEDWSTNRLAAMAPCCAPRLATPHVSSAAVALRLSFGYSPILTSGLETLLAGGGWSTSGAARGDIHHAHDGGGLPRQILALNEVLVARGGSTVSWRSI